MGGADWCGVVYPAIMAEAGKSVRQSVSLPSAVARRVQALAKRQRTSANRVLVELIETGLDAREQEKKTFLELADRLARSSDGLEQKRIKEELARLTFGE
jgi:predicted DNA-binding protein